MARPTRATEAAAHIAVGAAAAYVVPKVIGKGAGTALLGAVIAIYLHTLLDAPLARLMGADGIQL
jgi:hypothetical protein